MNRCRAAALIAAVSLLPLSVTRGQTPPAVAGYVFRAPDSLSRIAGIDVRLVGFGDSSVSLVATGKTGENGSFRLPAPKNDSLIHYRVEALYGGVWQPADPFLSPTTVVQLAVFDTTSRTDMVRVEKLHLIANPLDAGIAVTAIYILRNDGPIFVGREGPEHQHGRVGLEFFLPPGAADVQIFEGSAAGHPVETVRGFGSLVPFYPGIDTVVFGFTVPWDGRRVEFPVESPYPILSFSAITMQGTAQLLVEGGERVSSEEAPDLVAYGRRAIPANTPIMIEIRAPGVGRFPLSWAIVIGIGVAMLGVAGLLTFRRRATKTAQRSSAATRADKGATTLRSPVYELVDEIARLDEEHEAGTIPEGEYAEKRRELKERLVQALREEKRSG